MASLLKNAILFLIVIVAMQFCGCGKKSELKTESRIPVTVSIVPQKFFVEKIGGDYVTVSVMVEPGASPHLYEPRPSQMVKLSESVLYFAVGIEFERVWLPRFEKSAQKLSVVSLDSGIEKIEMESSHRDHEEGEHHHAGMDPHIWLSPELVKGIAKRIAAGLCSVDPARCKEYTGNRDAFIKEIETFQSEIKEILKQGNVDKFMVFHPSWGYFAREFNLQQIPVELEGKKPLPKELAYLIDFSKREGINTIFIQPQFSEKAAETIASQINGKVVPIDPLAYQWDRNLTAVANALAGK